MKPYPIPKATAVAVMLAFAGTSGLAVAAEEPVITEAVTVKGILPSNLEAVPGSFNVVDEKALEERQPFSMEEALNNVPGVNVVGESAYGLGINIGVRGMDPRRTARTLLMEDGMPLFLSPYGDPSAHYTTPLERLQRIEVVKGSGQVLYGPQTVGGMINFVTKPVPTNGFAGSVTGKVGTDDYVGGHVNIGYGDERGGFMIDALQNKGDGIRDDHDFDQRNITLKGQLNLSERHTLIGKVGYYEEDSHISETMLSRAEYAADKFQAPTGKNDKFQMEQWTTQLQHIFQINDSMKLSTQAYYADIERASFRQVSGPGGWEDDDYWEEHDAFSTIRHCPAGQDDAMTEANAAKCGGQWRPREYNYWGIEPRLDFSHNLFGIENDAVVGFRYHREDILRQGFRGTTPLVQSLGYAKQFKYVEDDGVNTAWHRERLETDVTALSYYAQNTFYIGNWSLTPGLRFEDVKVKQNVVWAEGEAQGVQDTNRYNELLPGFGVAWNGIANTTIFAGVHKGFAPPRPDRDLSEENDQILIDNTKPEESTNWELGIRSNYFKGIGVEATLFHNDFDEIVIRNGSRFDNGGKSLMQGLELAGRVDFGTIFNTSHNVYVAGNYTNLFTAKFKKDSFEDVEVDAGELSPGALGACPTYDPNSAVDFEGTCQLIKDGSRLPYAPKHMASLNFGYEHPIGIHARIGWDYVSSQEPDPISRVSDPQTGVSGKIPSYTLFNASASYKPQGTNATIFLSGSNLADKEYLASRVNGMTVGRGRTVFGGIRYDF
jgi:Fe(3+) dicitrate transport protein